MKKIEGQRDIIDARIGIVASRYNSHIVERLLDGCIKTLQQAGLKQDAITLVRVPGAFEIPLAVKTLARQDTCDAIVALGAVIRGETPHFDYICNECAHGLNQVALDMEIPVAFGVLTVDTMAQATDRSGDEESNKGAEAALTAIEMIDVLRQING